MYLVSYLYSACHIADLSTYITPRCWISPPVLVISCPHYSPSLSLWGPIPVPPLPIPLILLPWSRCPPALRPALLPTRYTSYSYSSPYLHPYPHTYRLISTSLVLASSSPVVVLIHLSLDACLRVPKLFVRDLAASRVLCMLSAIALYACEW
ncbi:hypothetical protein BV20DRAFT_357688 [Pilatotrama ljubarskyi]|nr:hypothetical protein BV20DRAFT_357688 [Pilatotrama ljubarskyi]